MRRVLVRYCHAWPSHPPGLCWRLRGPAWSLAAPGRVHMSCRGTWEVKLEWPGQWPGRARLACAEWGDCPGITTLSQSHSHIVTWSHSHPVMQSTPGWQASHSVGEEIVLRNYHWPDPAQPGRVETPGASQPSSNIHEHYGNLSPGYFPPSRDDTVTTDMMDELQSARDSLAQYWRCAVIKTANSLAISWWSQRRPELKANLTSHCSHSLHIFFI